MSRLDNLNLQPISFQATTEMHHMQLALQNVRKDLERAKQDLAAHKREVTPIDAKLGTYKAAVDAGADQFLPDLQKIIAARESWARALESKEGEIERLNQRIADLVAKIDAQPISAADKIAAHVLKKKPEELKQNERCERINGREIHLFGAGVLDLG